MMIKAVIFDFGGVIVDISGSDSAAEIAFTLGEDVNKFKTLHGPFVKEMAEGKIDEEGYWRAVSELTGKPRPTNWIGLWRDKARENTKLFLEMVELVQKLKEGGISCVVLSNTIPPHEEVMRKNGWYEMFDRLYFSNRTGYHKPDIRAFENVLKSEKLKAAECVFVDDTAGNLIPAEKLGMKVVLAVNPRQTADEVMQAVGLEN